MNYFFKRLLVSKYGLHIIFWSLQVLSNALSEITIYDNDKPVFFLNLLTLHALQITICCLNVFVLIPHVYKSGKQLIYWLMIIFMVVIYSYAITRLQHHLFGNYFSTSETLSKSLYHFTLNTFSIIRYLLITMLIALAREWLLKTFREKEQKAEQAKSEAHFLRSQLNPHFLFNTLNSIYALVLTQSSQAKEIILKLSDIMKYTLYESTQPVVTLKEDIGNIMNYIDLERLRQGNNASIETHISYGTGDQLICPLLFLPLVENAFKHGVNNKIHNAFFLFSLVSEENRIISEISNSKTDETAKINKNHTGIGLDNLQKRLALFYPGKHQLEINDSATTYTAKLTIDIS